MYKFVSNGNYEAKQRYVTANVFKRESSTCYLLLFRINLLPLGKKSHFLSLKTEKLSKFFKELETICKNYINLIHNYN